ncbi:hypothetical protein [Novosphingobium pokkalii]|uniref:DUF4261 domain-containing protein n=1 Tax=Novosphingobium pokkalii TaxID=1770194 RepID=A0ABV7UZ62_9SPHN|nr:hypothetical protein [Novosphingobium pokkalii]GHC87318.1 hypothetical protein GCM10019060_09590 [Novosphingobium pokkalii]
MSNGKDSAGGRAVATLLFAPGARPDADALAALAQAGQAFAVSHRPVPPADWVELLRDGLTFDISGLSPGLIVPGAPAPLRVGLPAGFDCAAHEAVLLAPGPHLAGAENLLPVVQVAVSLILALAALPGLAAIGWLPAGNLVSPRWFVDAVRPWLEGGPFPALALAGLKRGTDRVVSHGLAFFVGQEFEFHTGGERPGEVHARAAVRLVDWLVAHGRLATAQAVSLPDTAPLWLEPGENGIIAIRWA